MSHRAGRAVAFASALRGFQSGDDPPLKPEKIKNIETSLDDTVAIGIPKPASKEEEEELVRRFLPA